MDCLHSDDHRTLTPRIVGNCPLVCCLQLSTILPVMTKRRKQIQPRFGVERAFGEVIRKIRKEELKISQAELEQRTGLDRTFISDLERGIQGPGIRTLFRVAKGLEISAWDLVHQTTRSSLYVFPAGKRTT